VSRICASGFRPQAHEHQCRPHNAETVTIWCALGRNGVVTPYWFENADGRQVTANTERYVELMKGKFLPALRWIQGVNMDTVIYLQDGAVCFTRIPPSLFPWRQVHLLWCGTALRPHFLQT